MVKLKMKLFLVIINVTAVIVTADENTTENVGLTTTGGSKTELLSTVGKLLSDAIVGASASVTNNSTDSEMTTTVQPSTMTGEIDISGEMVASGLTTEINVGSGNTESDTGNFDSTVGITNGESDSTVTTEIPQTTMDAIKLRSKGELGSSHYPQSSNLLSENVAAQADKPHSLVSVTQNSSTETTDATTIFTTVSVSSETIVNGQKHVQNIVFPFAKPKPIGSTGPNSSDGLKLTTTVGQDFEGSEETEEESDEQETSPPRPLTKLGASFVLGDSVTDRPAVTDSLGITADPALGAEFETNTSDTRTNSPIVYRRSNTCETQCAKFSVDLGRWVGFGIAFEDQCFTSCRKFDSNRNETQQIAKQIDNDTWFRQGIENFVEYYYKRSQIDICKVMIFICPSSS